MVDMNKQSTEERFMERVHVDKVTGCWLWTASCQYTGYGRYRYNGKDCRAHRASYEIFVGTIPDGLDLDHLCRVRKCVNPEHLEPVTRRENLNRGIGISAINHHKTHCKNGHEFTPENTYITPAGYRQCQTCRNRIMKSFRKDKPEYASIYRAENLERMRKQQRDFATRKRNRIRESKIHN